MNDLSPYLVAAGKRVLGGKAGPWLKGPRGRLLCLKAPSLGIDANLLALLKLAVADLQLSVSISSVDTGEHVASSRHYDGRAVDLTQVAPYGHPDEPATLQNPHAVRFVEHLIACGFTAGHEAGAYPAVLFGPPQTPWNETLHPHARHIHASLPRAHPPHVAGVKHGPPVIPECEEGEEGDA